MGQPEKCKSILIMRKFCVTKTRSKCVNEVATKCNTAKIMVRKEKRKTKIWQNVEVVSPLALLWALLVTSSL